MPLLAGASPVAIAAVAAGVMLGKTETASQTASPLSARTPRFGASPSRMAGLRQAGRTLVPRPVGQILVPHPAGRIPGLSLPARRVGQGRLMIHRPLDSRHPLDS